MKSRRVGACEVWVPAQGKAGSFERIGIWSGGLSQ
jgi:hypothetical protein